MNEGYRTRRRVLALIGVLVAVVIGVVAYDAGVSHGLAQQVAAPAAGAYPYPYAWPHPWGFGGFGFFFPLLFAFLLLRLVFGGGFGYRRWRGHGGGYGACGHGVPPAFEEWHRRAHERGTPDQDRAATSV